MILQILCIIGYRLRGSAGEGGWVEKIIGFPIGTFAGRLLWCAPFAALVTPSWAMFLPLVGMAYIGVMFGYWGEFDLSLDKNRDWVNYTLLTLRGAFIALPACLVAGQWPAVFGGALFVPCYMAGLWISPRLKLPLLHGFSEWGELLLATSIITGTLI
jgi:hypothetical protein